jgi:hypothetical protein
MRQSAAGADSMQRLLALLLNLSIEGTVLGLVCLPVWQKERKTAKHSDI